MLPSDLTLSTLRFILSAKSRQSCKQDCYDFAERMKRKALRVRSEGSIPTYVTEAESRKQHSDSPLCNSLLTLEAIAHTYGKDASISLVELDGFQPRLFAPLLESLREGVIPL